MATRKGSSRKASKATAKPRKPAAKKKPAAPARAAKPAKAPRAAKVSKAPKSVKAAKAAPRREKPARWTKGGGEDSAPEAPETTAAPALEEPAEPEAQDEEEEEEEEQPREAASGADEAEGEGEAQEEAGSAPEPEPEEDEASGEVVTFQGVLTPNQPAGTFIPLTREQSERFPGAGIVRVTGTVGGVSIQSSLMPVGDGTRCLGVHKATMETGGFHHGDKVKVAIRLDTSPREVVVPKDFSDALEKSPAARRTFANYAYTHRKEYVNWIEEAKQPETRQRRIDQAVRMIEANEKLS